MPARISKMIKINILIGKSNNQQKLVIKNEFLLFFASATCYSDFPSVA